MSVPHFMTFQIISFIIAIENSFLSLPFFFFRRRLFAFLPNSIIMDTKKLSSKTCLWPSNFFSSYVIDIFFHSAAFFSLSNTYPSPVHKETKSSSLNGFLILNTHRIILTMEIWYIVKGVLSLIINLMINVKCLLICVMFAYVGKILPDFDPLDLISSCGINIDWS